MMFKTSKNLSVHVETLIHLRSKFQSDYFDNNPNVWMHPTGHFGIFGCSFSLRICHFGGREVNTTYMEVNRKIPSFYDFHIPSFVLKKSILLSYHLLPFMWVCFADNLRIYDHTNQPECFLQLKLRGIEDIEKWMMFNHYLSPEALDEWRSYQ